MTLIAHDYLERTSDFIRVIRSTNITFLCPWNFIFLLSQQLIEWNFTRCKVESSIRVKYFNRQVSFLHMLCQHQVFILYLTRGRVNFEQHAREVRLRKISQIIASRSAVPAISELIFSQEVAGLICLH